MKIVDDEEKRGRRKGHHYKGKTGADEKDRGWSTFEIDENKDVVFSPSDIADAAAGLPPAISLDVRNPRIRILPLEKRFTYEVRDYMKLALLGMNDSNIMQVMGVSWARILSLKKAAHKAAVKRVHKDSVKTLVGKALATYEQVQEEGWKQFHNMSPVNPNRMAVLNVIMTAAEKPIAMLAKIGLVEEAPKEVNVKVSLKAEQVLQDLNKEQIGLLAGAVLDKHISYDEVDIEEAELMTDFEED